jgi:hypothetical protein
MTLGFEGDYSTCSRQVCLLVTHYDEVFLMSHSLSTTFIKELLGSIIIIILNHDFL